MLEELGGYALRFAVDSFRVLRASLVFVATAATLPIWRDCLFFKRQSLNWRDDEKIDDFVMEASKNCAKVTLALC